MAKDKPAVQPNQEAIKVSATWARANFFDLLNQVEHHNATVIIMRNGREAARLEPSLTIPDYLAYRDKIIANGPFLTEEDARQIREARKDPSWERYQDWS